MKTVKSKLKSRLKSRRGVALASAMMFMVAMFSLCILLTSLASIGRFTVKLEEKLTLRAVEVDQIGEDFVWAKKEGKTFDKNAYEGYTCYENGGTLKVKSKNATVLYVALNEDGEVTAWRYSD